MDRTRFSSRSAGVLFWGAGYMSLALPIAVALAALWPQGAACTQTCTARIESGAITMGLLALGGACGLAIALWLGISRRPTAPRALVWLLATVCAGSLAIALILLRAASETSDAAGLETVHSAWAWAFIVPTAALLAMAGAARLRGALLARRAAPLPASVGAGRA